MIGFFMRWAHGEKKRGGKKREALLKQLREKKSGLRKEALEGECTGCGACVPGCAFLREHGSPKDIFSLAATDPERLTRLAYLCSLCGLCTATCRKGADPAEAFLNIRRNAVESKGVDFAPYRKLLGYESLGVSKAFSWAHLPSECRTLFFPGCGLSGSRPGKVVAAWRYLQSKDPATGLVLDCCTKPSHDLGRQDAFEAAFGELHAWCLKMGILKVVVACPNCFKVFSRYGSGLEVVSIYEVMAGDGSLSSEPILGEVYLHHPCATRFESAIQDASDVLLARSAEGLFQNGEKTLC